MRSRRQKVAGFFINFFATAAFIILTVFALLWANGVTFNFKTGSFTQTAVVAVDASFDNVQVYLNGQLIGNETPLTQRNLSPGRYEIIISKDGYRSYRQTFQLGVGQVGLVKKSAVLLASKPKADPLTSADASYEAKDAYDNGLATSSSELIDNGKLITRFSQELIQVHRFNGNYLYQVGNELRIFLPDNNQDELIATLPDSSLAKVNLEYFGWSVVIFKADGSATRLHLLQAEPTAASAN